MILNIRQLNNLLISILVILFLFLSCKPKEVKPIEEQPQTKEQYIKQLHEILNPLRAFIPTSPETPTPGLKEEVRIQVLNALFEFVQKNSGNPTAQEACKEVSQEVAQWAKIAKEQNRWVLALACIDVFELLGARSEALQRLKERGQLLITTPKIMVRGFLDDKETGNTTIFVEVINRQTGESKRVAARVGDEFDNIRVVDIIPFKNIVRFEYIPIEGMFFDVEGPKF
ncbi:MAG TPA: hypothetical protein PLT82_11505 [Candidatus Hydrogenedens sp.]|nr:hypothetical protein [Candidatus Hydrogenedens sp.]HOK10215.1 hypothetical protein [Candidatus Hydrogenedens sp.]HOL18850.1 hypothetical protein [Candidatus Hydrogenedens sp.]HPP59748.1 hypothetical protein [Candidatus Hydrogenedens sp.]